MRAISDIAPLLIAREIAKRTKRRNRGRLYKNFFHRLFQFCLKSLSISPVVSFIQKSTHVRRVFLLADPMTESPFRKGTLNIAMIL